MLLIGNDTISVTSSSAHGCVKSATKVIRINYAPNVNFTADGVCVSSEDTISFTNTTLNKDMVSGWKWNFDDPASGSSNTSTMEETDHIFTSGGMHTITLIGETTLGCSDTLMKDINFHERPVGSFRWESECFNDGTPTLFISEMKSGETIGKYEWTFVNPNGGSITKNNNDSIYYTFNGLNSYTVKLYAETSGGCGSTAERIITLKPVITLKDEWPYYRKFQCWQGWMVCRPG